MIDRTDQVGEGARAKTPAGRFVVCFTRADYRQAASGLEKYLTEEIEVLAGAGLAAVCVFLSGRGETARWMPGCRNTGAW